MRQSSVKKLKREITE